MPTEQPPVPTVVMRLFDIAKEGAWLDTHQAGIYISACAATIRSLQGAQAATCSSRSRPRPHSDSS